MLWSFDLQPLIVLFARQPAPGHVKTRLGISPARAAALHTEFVREALRTIDSLPNVDLELSTDEPCDAWPEHRIARSIQSAGDLGERMYRALERGLRERRPKVMILGSDSPGLPAAHLGALLDSRADVSLGPTDDGGYYAMACSRVDTRMFAGVRWSSAATLEDTMRAAHACGLSIELGPGWFDVDRPRDLDRLQSLPGWRSTLERLLADDQAPRR